MNDLELELQKFLDRSDCLRRFKDRVEGVRLKSDLCESIVLFEVDRHPSLVGSATLGVPSGGYWLVREVWVVDLLGDREILESTVVNDLVVHDMSLLVGEDVDNTVDASESVPDGIKSADQIREHASGLAADYVTTIRDTLYPHENITDDLVRRWEEFVEAYLVAWAESFVEVYTSFQMERIADEEQFC